ncbi:LDCC motif putative metal-binding protein [uncultured Clostridium sp.]|nr:LDCC motif putative metal-binding protein [uncultured Clostridium sp.]
MRNLIKKFIKKLADENSKTFGTGEKLDCCNINKSSNAKKTPNK